MSRVRNYISPFARACGGGTVCRVAAFAMYMAVILAVPGAAQNGAGFGEMWDAPSTRWTASARASYNAAPGPAYESARVGLDFRDGEVQVGARVRLNEHLNFTFAPRDLVVYVDGAPAEFEEGTRFDGRPDRYTLGDPLEIFATARRGSAALTGRVSLVTQQTEVEMAEPHASNDGLYVIEWHEQHHRQARLVGALVGRYRWRGATLAAGMLALPMLRFGDRAFRYAYDPQVRPYLAAKMDLGSTALGASTNTQMVALTYLQALPHPWRGAPVRARVRYRTTLDRYALHALRLALDVPVSARLTATLGLARGWSPAGALLPQDFAAWQETLVPGDADALNQSLPHTVVSAGLRVHLGRDDAPTIELRRFDLRQDRFYSANRTFYARNPIGTVDLFNPGEESVRTRLVVETTDTHGTYESKAIDVPPGEERRVPLFLYLGEPTDGTRHEQLLVTAELGERRVILTSEPVVTHGPNAWDGDTWSLRYFVAPEDEDIRQRAKRLFLETLAEADASTHRQFAHLQAFLGALGEEVAYVADPMTTRTIDRVQYPVETLREGGGDCEDLTVYLASSLMAVGIPTAVVDVRPVLPAEASAPTAGMNLIGHVFILVDTGIDASMLDALGLNEFEGLTRRSADGRPTIWIPIETSVIDEGFEAAFREGVRQYYRAVFRDDGFATGRVRVYDF